MIINGNISEIKVHNEPLIDQGYSEEDFMDMLGLLPHWVQAYSPSKQTPLRRFMEAHYGFPMNYHGDGEVDHNDRYHYPNDPPLNPLYAISFHSGQRMIIYQYGLVSFYDYGATGNLIWFHSRMD